MEIEGTITAAGACQDITGKWNRYLTVTYPVGVDSEHQGTASFDVLMGTVTEMPTDIHLGDKVKITIEYKR